MRKEWQFRRRISGRRMAGYGELTDSAATEIAGLVAEMQGLISRLDSYLAQGQSADLAQRLQRLEEAGSDIGLLKALERSIDRRGLVEFRPALGTIVDRLETSVFEIAVIGRVSSGKSSLLNHIVEQDVLSVGVNPITAVPTRLAYGSEPRATAWFADRKPEQIDTARLAGFVPEEHNPANVQHVTRIVVELPALRLREGVVYVDTPGLGSLATAGAAETRAYLPRCDLGVVLIDAGSTLTLDDLATIRTLYDAGIPACVLLSKADLLAPEDRDRALAYVAGHIRSDLGLELPVHAISIKDECSHLFDKWVDNEILPLYDRHAELARESPSRKIGALRLGVEAALKAHLKRSDGGLDESKVRELETEIRTAAGSIAQARTACLDRTDALREYGDQFVRTAGGAGHSGGGGRRLERKGEERGQPKEDERHEVIPRQFLLEERDGEYGKDRESDDLLNDLELESREVAIADAIGRHCQTVFDQGDTPRHHNGFPERPGMAIFQVSVPGECHEGIRHN
jgi:GTP-binding protein EngB required for normal cell division